MSSNHRATADDRLTKRHFGLLAVVVLLGEIAPLELTMIYPAISSISREFVSTDTGWVLTAVNLGGLISLPLLCRFATMYGRCRAYLMIIAVFSTGSVLSALASSLPLLLAGRALQGVAMALLPITYGLVREAVPTRHIPLALGIVGGGMGLSTLLGPVVGGALVDSVGYRGIFWFLAGYVLLFVPAVLLVVPDSGGRQRQRFDVLGAVLLGSGTALLLFVLTQASKKDSSLDVTEAAILVLLAGVTLIAFVRHERKIEQPMLDVRLLASSALSRTLIALFLGAAALSSFGFLVPLMVQVPRVPDLGYGLGASAVTAGLFLLPQGLMVVIGGPLAGGCAQRLGARTGILVGLLAMCGATALLSFLHTEVWHVLAGAALMGLGNAFVAVSCGTLIVQAVPEGQTVAASGMHPTAMNLGAAAGVALATAVLNRHVLAVGERVTYAEDGFHQALLAALFVAATALAVATTLHASRRRPGGSPAGRRGRVTAAAAELR